MQAANYAALRNATLETAADWAIIAEIKGVLSA